MGVNTSTSKPISAGITVSSRCHSRDIRRPTSTESCGGTDPNIQIPICRASCSLSDRTPNKGVQPIRYRSRLTPSVGRMHTASPILVIDDMSICTEQTVVIFWHILLIGFAGSCPRRSQRGLDGGPFDMGTERIVTKRSRHIVWTEQQYCIRFPRLSPLVTERPTRRSSLLRFAPFRKLNLVVTLSHIPALSFRWPTSTIHHKRPHAPNPLHSMCGPSLAAPRS